MNNNDNVFRIGRFKRFLKRTLLSGLSFIKERSIDCFRKGIHFETGQKSPRNTVYHTAKEIYLRIMHFYIGLYLKCLFHFPENAKFCENA